MNEETPQKKDEQTIIMQQEVARQHIAAERAQQDARFLASENATLRNRISDGSNGLLHMIGFLMAIGSIIAAVVFLMSSANETKQQAQASRQDAMESRTRAEAANIRANSAVDAARRSEQQAQTAEARARQAEAAAAQAERNAQTPSTVIVNPPSPAVPSEIVTPAEATPAPATVTEIPTNTEQPLPGRIE